VRVGRLVCGAAALFLTFVVSAVRADAAPQMAVMLNGRVAGSLTPGARINVVVRALPTTRRGYCLGLASAIDRAGLPVSLGRVVRGHDGVGRITATVPLRLFPAEPAGPYLLFVGVCTPIAPDRPFIARATVMIVPGPKG